MDEQPIEELDLSDKNILKKLTVKRLRLELKDRELNQRGKKKELIDKLIEYQATSNTTEDNTTESEDSTNLHHLATLKDSAPLPPPTPTSSNNWSVRPNNSGTILHFQDQIYEE